MRILFTAAGKTDPEKYFFDGAILHILRHYNQAENPIGKIYLFLTKEIQTIEDETHCYTNGIKRVAPDCQIIPIRKDIKRPHDLDQLGDIRKEFKKAFKENEGAEWLINISSGTPQIKTVMSFLALDYFPHATAIQVEDP
nr:hypothetical protein [Treponema sp.]